MTTSDDRALALLHALLQICRDGESGYATVARNVPDSALWRELEPYRKQRTKIVHQLQDRIRTLRGDPSVAPSAAAALHRTWLQLRSMTDTNPNARRVSCPAGVPPPTGDCGAGRWRNRRRPAPSSERSASVLHR